MKSIYLTILLLFSFCANAQQVTVISASSPANCNGTATVNSANFISWAWYDSQGVLLQSGGDTLMGLCSGTYSLIYDDGSGNITEVFNIGAISCNGFSASLSVTNDLLGNCTGSAAVSVSGGSSPYSYNWSTSNITSVTAVNYISNLCSGYVDCSIVDINGCTTYVINQIISDPCNFSINVAMADEWPPANCNGEIGLSVAGGTGPFTYSWSNGDSTSMAGNLCVGWYSCQVMDALGCVDSISGQITNICSNFQTYLSPVATSDSLTCDGAINVQTYGGTMPYTYLWSNGLTLEDPINLCIGSYSVMVTDAYGCVFNTSTTVFDTLNANPCNTIGTGISLNNASTANSCDGYLQLYGIGGTTFVSYNWSNGSTNNYIDNLCPGYYDVNAIDVNGCPTFMSFVVQIDTIANTGLSAVVYTADETMIGACDGYGQVVVFGGLAPFQYIHSSGVTGSTTLNLCAGQYSVTVIDANSDTVFVDYLISSTPGNIVYNPILDSINVNTLYSSVLQNCNIDLNSIDSAYMSSIYSNNVDSITIVWGIHSTNGWDFVEADYYVGSSISGVYTVELNLFCPQKSLGQYMKIYSELYINTDQLTINENRTFNIVAYPNPFSTEIIISLPDHEAYDFILVDLYGRVVREERSEGNDLVVQLTGLESLPGGEYLLHISGKSGVSIFKVIK